MKKLVLVAVSLGLIAVGWTIFAEQSVDGDCFDAGVTGAVRDLAFDSEQLPTAIWLYGGADSDRMFEWIKQDVNFVQKKSFWLDIEGTKKRVCSAVMTWHIPPFRSGKAYLGELAGKETGYQLFGKEYRWTYDTSSDGSSFLVNLIYKGTPSSPVEETEPVKEFVYGPLPADPSVGLRPQKIPGQGAPFMKPLLPGSPVPNDPRGPNYRGPENGQPAKAPLHPGQPSDATASQDKLIAKKTAQSRPAKCLLEVKGGHYLAGSCIFTPLDKLGSFRITDVQGLNLIAQVNASKKDEGKAVWNGPLGGNSPAKELGDAYRSGGCWTVSDSEPGKYEDSRICAWSLKDKVYLGPSPRMPDPSSIVYYGSRVGMYDEIATREGLDTRNARIVTKPSKDGAVTFCREYSRDYSMKCIDDQMRDQRVSTLRGNCQDKTFADANGNKYAFLGKAPKGNDEIMAEFSIRDLATGEILDGSSASGYDVRLGIYQALCPSSAPKRLE